MKNLIFTALLFSFILNFSTAQIQNPSFEENGMASLEGWLDYFCQFSSSENQAPPNGGEWCLKMQPGQTQGCFPGYFYQILPNANSEQVYQLNGWAKVDMEGTLVGIFLGRKDAEGTIHLFEGDTTSSETWTMLSVTDTIVLEPGDEAVVVMNSGLVGGPVGASHSSYFDEIELSMTTSNDEAYFKDLIFFPNPITGKYLNINFDGQQERVDEISVFDITGKLVFYRQGFKDKIDVGHFEPGIYCVKLKADGYNIVKKVIVN